jgi:hypothetical protein
MKVSKNTVGWLMSKFARGTVQRGSSLSQSPKTLRELNPEQLNQVSGGTGGSTKGPNGSW